MVRLSDDQGVLGLSGPDTMIVELMVEVDLFKRVLGFRIASIKEPSACSEQGFISSDGVDVFYQDPMELVDILMVVDNSCSMDPYQEKLGASFETFINYFIDANIDYNIAVITTDIESDMAGQFVGEVINRDTEEAATVFNDLVNVGVKGSGLEMGLESAKQALSESLLSSTNTGFLRDDAALSIIFTSDEEDSSPEPVNHYINTFFDVKGQRSRDVFNASALAVINDNSCTGEDQAYSTSGTRYIDVAEQTNGIVGDICAEEKDFATIVNDLSLNASRLREIFYLSDWPDTASLTLAIDETFIECDAGVWTYLTVEEDGEERPAIQFSEENIPPISSRIEVRYDFGDGEIETFCTDDGETT